MARYSKTKREEARRLYLTGEATSASEIAKRLKTKPHTIGTWRRDERSYCSSARSMARTAVSCISGKTWLYTSRVSATLLCPSICWTIRGFTFSLNMRVAHE